MQYAYYLIGTCYYYHVTYEYLLDKCANVILLYEYLIQYIVVDNLFQGYHYFKCTHNSFKNVTLHHQHCVHVLLNL